MDLPYEELNLNSQLSEMILDIPVSERAKQIGRMLAELIAAAPSELIEVHGIEILFDRSLSADPIQLLKNCSREKTLMVVWPGNRSASELSYASPVHPEHRVYRSKSLSDVVFLEL